MAKVYILKDQDFDALLLRLDRAPERGSQGGSSRTLTIEEKQAFEDAHRFYNYQIRTWIEEVQR
jgi:hypothetical protein